MPPELFDTHCHLTDRNLVDHCERVVADAASAGITRLITIVCVAGEFERAMQMREQCDHLWIAAGIHPHEAGRTTDTTLQQLRKQWKQPGVVAAGEMGLDYHYDFSPQDAQRTVFEKQLASASEIGLPVIIHSRKAHTDTVRILRDQGYADKPVVFHCFSGSPDEAAELRENGWWLSFTGIITFRNADAARQACVETPDDRLLFETDAPYLSPEPIRHIKPNQPAYLVHTVRFAAEQRNQTFESLASTTTANAIRFFLQSREQQLQTENAPRPV